MLPAQATDANDLARSIYFDSVDVRACDVGGRRVGRGKIQGGAPTWCRVAQGLCILNKKGYQVKRETNGREPSKNNNRVLSYTVALW